MSGWGIADTAPKIEKIKAESADYLNGLNSCGKIEWSIYSEMFDFYADLIEEAYAQGKEGCTAGNQDRRGYDQQTGGD